MFALYARIRFGSAALLLLTAHPAALYFPGSAIKLSPKLSNRAQARRAGRGGRLGTGGGAYHAEEADPMRRRSFLAAGGAAGLAATFSGLATAAPAVARAAQATNNGASND